MVNYVSPGAIIITLVSFALLFITEKSFYKKNKILSSIPGPLLVVVFGILLSKFFSSFEHEAIYISSEHLVNLPLLSGFSDLSNVLLFPDFSLIYAAKFWMIVFTIAIVTSLESLLSIKACDKLDPEKRDSNSNKELFAQGIGNILCGLVGALPVTAVIVRSAANINAGAKTKLSSIIHAILLLLSVILIPKVLMLIPNASLASVLIVIGYKLARPALFKEHYIKGLSQLAPFIITIIVMLLTDLLRGVTAGIIVSIIFIIRENIRTSFKTAKGRIDNKIHYLIKLPQNITYLNKGYLLNYFSSIKPNSKVIVDGTNNKTIDSDASDIIEDFILSAKSKKIEVELIKYNLKEKNGKIL
jgi:MFS superfamily sulfate permease-like transporter